MLLYSLKSINSWIHSRLPFWELIWASLRVRRTLERGRWCGGPLGVSGLLHLSNFCVGQTRQQLSFDLKWIWNFKIPQDRRSTLHICLMLTCDWSVVSRYFAMVNQVLPVFYHILIAKNLIWYLSWIHFYNSESEEAKRLNIWKLNADWSV